MKQQLRRLQLRGFTLIEMLVAMGVMAIAMTIAALEFQYVVAEHTFIESHLTAEQQARLALAKVNAAAKQTSVDINLGGNGTPPPPVIEPEATPGTVLQFYRVHDLTNLPQTGVPTPNYDIVTIALNKQGGQVVGDLEESIAPAPSGIAGSPSILARNVQDFTVQPVANVGNHNGYRVDITIYDAEDHSIDQRAGASYHLSTVISPLVFGKAL